MERFTFGCDVQGHALKEITSSLAGVLRMMFLAICLMSEFYVSRTLIPFQTGLLRDSLRLYWSEQVHRLRKILDRPYSRPQWEINDIEQVC